MGGVTGPVYGDKLKGISEEKAADAVQHALDLCKAPRLAYGYVDQVAYNDRFVPAFMARLGLKDVKEVPVRSALDLVHRTHLAKKEEETLNARHETYQNKKDESDEEESGSSDDEDEESDGFVGSDSDDDDAAATTKVTAVVPCAPLRRRLRNVPKSEDDLLAEKLAPVHDALRKADLALQKAVRDKCATQEALRAIGLSGFDSRVLGFAFEDKDYAIKWAETALPEEHGLDFASMPTSREVWRGLIRYHRGLADGVLEKRITATRECCADLDFDHRSTYTQNAHVAPAIRAAAVAGSKRRKMNADADAEAIESLREFEDDQGALLPPNSAFHRSVVPLQVELLPDHVAPDLTQLVWAKDAETGQPVLIKAGEMQEKVILGRGSEFQLGLSSRGKDQEPIGRVVRVHDGDAALMTGDAWNGHPLGDGTYVTHRGRGGPFALCLDFRDRASTWALGGHDDMDAVRSSLGLKLVSSTAVVTTEGTLEDFRHARFESTGEIPGGLSALMEDCEVLCAKMRDASSEAAGGEVWLIGGLQLERLGRKGASEGTTRFNIVQYSRCAGCMNSLQKLKLDYLESQGLKALHHVSLKAALLGHIQVRLVGYAHAAAGNFHPDGSVVGPIRSTRMANSAAMAAPANLRSWNFSSGTSGPMPALMGPALGPSV
mmetsp:Transcript_8578/g.26800  ORF Transcript_8578/g.26800 Transcript_8578/m.26800 type:complete len:662 (+) Transcript_8578:245-2230(+)